MSRYPYEAIRGPGQSGYASHSKGLKEAVDFRTPMRTPLFVPDASWRVTVSQNLGGDSYGQWIELAGPVRLRFAHLDARLVRRGDRLSGGELFARTGNTGNSTGPHLHFEADRNIWEWAEDIWAPTQEEDWFDMATKAELRQIVQDEVERVMEWQLAALAKIMFYKPREVPDGFGGDLAKVYRDIIAKGIKDQNARDGG